jgi:hypothetical protein
MWIVDLVKFRPADAEVVSGLDHILPANTVYSPVRPKGALGLATKREERERRGRMQENR